MTINWGSVPDWIGGLGTSGTLLTALLVSLKDRERRLKEEAANLVAELELDGDDYGVPSDLLLTVSNHGTTTFWDLTVYRAAEVQRAGESASQLKRYVAALVYVDPNTTYTWTVEQSVTLATGRGPHPTSFEIFHHAGRKYARIRWEPLRRLGRRFPERKGLRRSRVAALLDRELKEFERHDVIRLDYSQARAHRQQG